MGGSSISSLKNMRQGCVLYTSLIGQPSTGKTTAMSIVRDAVIDVEEALNINIEESKLLNCKIFGNNFFVSYI
jgi:hypothetical protein